MNSLGVIKLSHEMMDHLEFLTPWKEGVDFSYIKDIISGSPVKIEGFVFLSTCNRVEIIYKIQNPQEHKLFYHYILKKMPEVAVAPELITGRPVALHLLKLASGLESMVIGETEIRHQLKEAVKQSKDQNVLSPVLQYFFQSIFRESKNIRTHIPANIPLSIASLGVRNLEEKLGGFASRDGILIVIGSGTISKTSIEYIRKWNGINIVWVNRTLSRIEEEAKQLGIPAVSLDVFLDPEKFHSLFPEPLAGILTATSSPQPILTASTISKYRYQKLVIIDLAMPPDVEDDVSLLPNVHYTSLQTIKEQLENNRKRREEAAQKAMEVLEDSLYKVEADWVAIISSPVIKEIQEKVHFHSRKRLESLFEGQLKHLSMKDKRILYNWAIRFHREMNRIHRAGVEKILKHYFHIHK